MWTDLDLSLFYILIVGTQSTFARENNFLALGVCCPGTTKRVPHMSNRDWNWVRQSNPSRFVDDYACKNQRFPTPPWNRISWYLLIKNTDSFWFVLSLLCPPMNKKLRTYFILHMMTRPGLVQKGDFVWITFSTKNERRCHLVKNLNFLGARAVRKGSKVEHVDYDNKITWNPAQEWSNSTVAEHACGKM